MARVRNGSRIFGNKLKALRDRQSGMTQREFAEEMGISLEAVKNWEQGWDYPKSIRDIIKIADFFKCDYDYLLGDQKSPNKEYDHISEMTGLSYIASEYLSELKERLPQSEYILSTLSEMIIQTMRQEENGNDYALLPQLAYYARTIYAKDLNGNIIDRDNYMTDFGRLIREVENFAESSRDKRYVVEKKRVPKWPGVPRITIYRRKIYVSVTGEDHPNERRCIRLKRN